MSAKRKRHLQFRAKKAQSMNDASEKGRGSAKLVDRANSLSDTEPAAKQITEQRSDKQSKKNDAMYTKLPKEETNFIRRELFYIGMIAVVIILLYIGIMLLFRFTQIDEWLNSLIKLGSG